MLTYANLYAHSSGRADTESLINKVSSAPLMQGVMRPGLELNISLLSPS